MSRTADIAIIGGGIVGMSSAWELARRGAGKVVVLDKQNPASGTTGGSAGVICPVDLGEIYALMNLAGYARIRHLHEDHGLSFSRWGNLRAVYEPDSFPPPPSEYAARFGGEAANSIYTSEVLEVPEVRRRYPWIRPQVTRGGVARRLLGAVWYRNQGFIDPYELVSLYERLAVETGRVEVHRNTPVLQIREEGARVRTLVTRRGAFEAGQVLNAAGPWGAKVAGLAGTSMALTPQRIQVCVATAFDDGVEEAPLTGVPEPVDGVGVWSRGELGGTLLFGQHHHTTRPGIADDPDHVNRLNDEGYPASVARVYRRYWDLPESQFLNGWCCVYGTTEDGYPILSPDSRLDNLHHALGMNGHGIIMHAAVSTAMAGLLLDRSPVSDLGEEVGRWRRLDVSRLDMGRFDRGEALSFDLAVEDLESR